MWIKQKKKYLYLPTELVGLGLNPQIMNWNEIICPNCGLVNDYTITEKANNSVCTCNGCDKFLGNKPKDISGQTLPFGKHKGRLIKDVAIEDLPYLLWYFRECQEKLSPNCVAALKFHLNIK
jgi:hypothetical protein